jgi:hypothetical protein
MSATETLDAATLDGVAKKNERPPESAELMAARELVRQAREAEREEQE